MKKNSMRLTFIFLLLLQLPAFAQQKKKTGSLLQKSNWLDFVIIKIDQYTEVMKRYEVDVVYLNQKDKNFKIHAVVNSNNETSKKIDTVFTLSTTQQSILEDFYNHFQKNDFSVPKPIPATNNTTFSCTVDGETITVESKSQYSLIEALLKK
jgi:hypothetical protein